MPLKSETQIIKPNVNIEIDEGPKEECGIVGIYAPGMQVANSIYFGLFALQHRGQESAGIAVVSPSSEINLVKDVGLVNQVFNQENLQNLQGHLGIGHTRYSTTGSNVQYNAQPLCCTSVYGKIAVAHNGNLVNTKELREQLGEEGVSFESTNDSEVIALLLSKHYGTELESAVKTVMPMLQGAFSLAIMNENKVIGIRDSHGIRPLCIGKTPAGHYVIASETCALNVMGAEFIREIEPGEMVILDKDGIRSEQVLPFKRHAMCLFEFIYFARPDSQIYGKTLYFVRKEMGRQLARECPADADIVIPIPDSATPAALGYAEESGIPFAEGVIKNRYIQRTFIEPNEQLRHLGARMKYSPLHEQLRGKRVVMVDDSIVRGTTTDKLVKMLLDAGAIEVHVRISAPPVKHPCFYGIDMANQIDLIAHRMDEDAICKSIGATTLGYLSREGVIKAIDRPMDRFCRACFDGEYPIHVPDDLRRTKEQFEVVKEKVLATA